MPPELQFFSSKEGQVLGALVARMVSTGPDVVPVAPTDQVLATMDAYVVCLPSRLQGQLKRALRIFEWCPVLFIGKLRPFSRMSPRDQDTYIRTWAESRLRVRRRVFRALRDLVFLAYYTQDTARESLGHRDSRG